MLVSLENSIGLDAILNDYCATPGANYVLKKEGELLGLVFTKNLRWSASSFALFSFYTAPLFSGLNSSIHSIPYLSLKQPK